MTSPHNARLLFSTNAVLDERDVNFNLYTVLKVEQGLFETECFEDHSKEFVDEALATAATIAYEQFLPHSRKNDLNEPHFDPKTNKVEIIPEVPEALEAFYEAGFGMMHASEDMGGMNLPSVVTNSLMFPFYAGNVGTITFPFLTIAAGNMLYKYGTPEQVEKYLPAMLEGKRFGVLVHA